MSGDSHKFSNPVIGWIDQRLPLFSIMHHTLYEYPVPKNLNWWWGFGSLASVFLIIQIVTGIVLVMHYTPHADLAFSSIEHIMRNVNSGWLIRYMHMNGASFFFIVVFIHIFRGLYYGSYKYPRELLWIIGVIILLLMTLTAFMGYVLPWGQMSFWGATVITNMVSAVPWVGQSLVHWLWGGFSVDNPTLNRFFALHYVMPFVILALVFLHLVALHTAKSNNPLGIDVKSPQDTVSFHPLYTWKDFAGFGFVGVFYAIFVFFAPNYLGHADNYIPANPLVTPAHIVPEWYFLTFYAILRSIPDKLLGVIAMVASIVILVFVPWLDRSKVRSCNFRPVYRQFFWVFFFNCFLLGLVGANSPSDHPFGIEFITWLTVGRVATFYYFAHFLIFLPWVSSTERVADNLPKSISQGVLGKRENISAVS